ncbi:MAG: AMP-binding protein [Pseudomonadota bacterium]
MPPTASPTQALPAAPPSADAAGLLSLVEAMLRELRPGAAELPPVTLASRLDQDLGLDSLARMELLLRAERAFGVALHEDALGTVQTLADLLRAVERGHPLGSPVARPPPPAPSAGPSAGTPQTACTLLEVLAWHVREHADRVQVTVLQEGEERPVTYAALAADAAAVAAGLQALGVAPRETVAIMLPTCSEYLGTYLGILMAGAIPVPIYPPGRPSQIEEHVLRHGALLDNARAVALVTVPQARMVARLLQARVAGLRAVVTPQQLSARGDGWLDTGDRAYAAAGDIYITGRVKDIVIRGGRNLYPEEIEDAVGQVPRRGRAGGGLAEAVRLRRQGRTGAAAHRWWCWPRRAGRRWPRNWGSTPWGPAPWSDRRWRKPCCSGCRPASAPFRLPCGCAGPG